MRRLPLVALLVLLTLAGCSDVPTSPTEASVSAAAGVSLKVDGNHGAVRWIPDPNCAVLDTNGDFVLTDCRNQIATYSRNGNAIAMVQANGIPNPTGEVVTWDAWNVPPSLLGLWGLTEPPAPCWVIGPEGEALFTVNWWASITPGGHAKMVCHYAKQWEWTPPPGWPPS